MDNLQIVFGVSVCLSECVCVCMCVSVCVSLCLCVSLFVYPSTSHPMMIMDKYLHKPDFISKCHAKNILKAATNLKLQKVHVE